MKIDLSGKSAIVTGSSAGIGLAAAKALAQAGANVVINGRKAETVTKAVETVSTAAPNVKVQGFVGDLSKAEVAEELFRQHPSCDVLVNNLGIYAWKDFFEATDEEWAEFVSVNVTSGIRISRHYMPAMMSNGWGRVIFISSESGLNIPADMIFYATTKTAQLALARGLAKRAAGTGVTVNSVLPGPTLSDGVVSMIEGSIAGTDQSVKEAADAFVKANRPSSIIQRTASVEEVANMIVYIASPLSSATTGAALRVEGGIVDSIG
ncbi:SDR family NAD(P)-dependent oxidoreductase [Rhizobium sp. BE258]|uniref:SDR family NAD(P)-dependent oxidoreductase n=1 Tax=Rhizobium sp. BE258 TaxID=2817722 RepID=UPI000DD5CAD9|nr:SDR family oxidoreductase [Rhizobium sp. BE258]MDR7145025.1 NAD(P)-dependent dehydrogenase (short-subunit alcohol dehydrogenase family) [Rhizobium sp. BE258]